MLTRANGRSQPLGGAASEDGGVVVEDPQLHAVLVGLLEVVAEDLVLIAGGESNGNATATLEVFEPSTASFWPAASSITRALSQSA